MNYDIIITINCVKRNYIYVYTLIISNITKYEQKSPPIGAWN